MHGIQAGVKDEPFEVSLKNSEVAVAKACVLLQKTGYTTIRLQREKNHPDHGDILIYRQDDRGVKSDFHTVDAKQNFNWKSGHNFPYPTIYQTANDELHFSWWYIIFNNDLSRAAFVDMNRVPEGLVTYDETTNRRGHPQLSSAVPLQDEYGLSYVGFKEIK